MKKEKEAYRHGDVILLKSNKLPNDVKTTGDKDLVFAKGEVTGHAHRILAGAILYESQNDGSRYLKVREKTARLTHEEHKAIDLPKGVYQILIQREYEPDGWREVMD
ncbi:MAG: hypothetical protein OEZ36_06635 [Spirochaetota bacterium]|nr:hypothetical protein [Spirochaetota bacterium]